jgi:uncharacterized protein (DUF1015 family)
MAKINPFQAVRPTKKNVQNFSSRSYKTYSKDELKKELKENPTSFLSIINIKKNPSFSPEKSKRYELVKKRFEAFKTSNILIKDPLPSYYIYETIQANGHLFCGVIATASVEDYENQIIKKHEATISKRENTFKNYLKKVRFNAAPVLLTYSNNLTLETGIQNAKKKASEFHSWTSENEIHKLWCINDPETVNFIQKGFLNIPTLYIADGHHRSASSVLLARELNQREHTTSDAYCNHFLTYLIPESQLKIYDYNRVITDLNGLSCSAFLEKIRVDFEIENKGSTPYKSSKRHDISMYLEGAFYSLSLRTTKQKNQPVINQLDTHILQTHLLEPILGIKNVRTNSRIGYIYGADSMEQIKATVDSGAHAVGFGLFPIETRELMDIADSGAVMPPKSTYIYPKLRSGITIYEF